MNARNPDPAGLRRIPERDVSPRDIRWLAEIDVDRAALEERWGRPETAHDSLGEWICFAFSATKEEAFLLLREAEHPPTPRFGLSVTEGLFSADAAARIVEAIGVPGARVTQVNAEGEARGTAPSARPDDEGFLGKPAGSEAGSRWRRAGRGDPGT